MKKSLFVGLFALGVAIVGTSFAAAATPPTSPIKDMTQMQSMCTSMMEQAIKNGTMTAEQAKKMEETMKGMCNSMNKGNMANCCMTK